jgi:DNA modification methylase
MADMVFTDPPYNVAGNSRNYAADKSKAMNELKESDWDQNFDISTLFPILETVMAKDCAVYICTSHWLVQMVWEWMWTWSDFCSYCVWCKPNPMPSLSKRHWTWATELIPYAVRGKHISNFPAEGHALNWWDIAKNKDTDHPTEKVIGVPERAIEFSSLRGQIVYDGFLGSGTTLIAAERLKRRCFGCEISEKYVAVALQRFQDTTGEAPVLLESSVVNGNMPQ